MSTPVLGAGDSFRDAETPPQISSWHGQGPGQRYLSNPALAMLRIEFRSPLYPSRAQSWAASPKLLRKAISVRASSTRCSAQYGRADFAESSSWLEVLHFRGNCGASRLSMPGRMIAPELLQRTQ